MKHAYVFPGQGSQAVGMGKDIYDNVPVAKEMFEKANEILGFRITDIMFSGTPEELKQTKVTQPAVFLHSVILAKALDVKPDAVAGHSLGEFSALVVAGALSFEDGLKLVSKRAMAMQKCCEQQPGGMAAVLGLDDKTVEEVCASVDGIVVGANYNCPGQLVISGADAAVDEACWRIRSGQVVMDENGGFVATGKICNGKNFTITCTIPNENTAVDNIVFDQAHVEKLMRDGQIVISIDGVEFDVQGRVINQ